MIKTEVFNWLKRSKIVPVIRAKSAAQAIAVTDLLLQGGIDVFEITMTVPGAIDVIHQLREIHQGRALIGAGTVLDSNTAQRCIGAGANFIVSPNTDATVIEACLRAEVLCAPGALTPTEVVTAHRIGADIVKVFPCDSVGGAKYIRALKAPLPHIELMPTGGVDLSTIAGFLQAGACAVGVGTSLVNLDLLESNPQELVLRARDFHQAVANLS